VKPQTAGDQAKTQTPKVACKPTAAIAKENAERAAKTASQNAMKSKGRVQNHAINTGKAAKPGANHRFEAPPSLQSP